LTVARLASEEAFSEHETSQRGGVVLPAIAFDAPLRPFDAPLRPRHPSTAPNPAPSLKQRSVALSSCEPQIDDSSPDYSSSGDDLDADIWDDPRHPPLPPAALDNFDHALREKFRTDLGTLYDYTYGRPAGHSTQHNTPPNLDTFKKRRSHHFFPRPVAYSSLDAGLLDHGLGKTALWVRIQIGTGPDPYPTYQASDMDLGTNSPARFETARAAHALSGPEHIRDAGASARQTLADMLELVDTGYSQDLRIAALAKVVYEDLFWAKCSPLRRKFLDEQRAALAATLALPRHQAPGDEVERSELEQAEWLSAQKTQAALHML
jgi:hypothetical protein